MQLLYTTQATAHGGRVGTAQSADGRLKVNLTHPVIQPRPATGTDPEQLFGAGYAACYAGACAYAAKLLGIELAASPECRSEVQLMKRDDEGFTVRVALHIILHGVDQTQAEAIAAKGHSICPYSNIVRQDAVSTTAVGVPLTA
jgi:osmotically inducible protein OsmC